MVISPAPSALEMTPGSESRRSGIVQDITTAWLGIIYEAIGIHGREEEAGGAGDWAFYGLELHFSDEHGMFSSPVLSDYSFQDHEDPQHHPTRYPSEMTDWEAGARVALDERGGTKRCFFLA